MWVLWLLLNVLNLIFVYNNKFLASKIIAIVTVIHCCISSLLYDILLPLCLISGLFTLDDLIWVIVNIMIVIAMCVFVFKKNRKASLILLWIMLFIHIFANWNTWYTYIFYLMSLFS